MYRVRFALVLAAITAASLSWAQPPAITDFGLVPGDLTIGAAVHSQQEHSIARGGDQFLAVWSDYRGQAAGGGTNQQNGDIFGVRLDALGAPLDATPFRIAGGMGLQNRPLVAWNGSNWLVVFISQVAVGGYYEHLLRGVRVSPAGQVLDATPIVFAPSAFTPSTIGVRVTGQNGQWLVTRCLYHADGYGTYLAGERVAGDGTLLDASPRLLLDWVYGATASLTANGEYLVAGPDWNNSSAFRAQRVGQNGKTVGAPFSVPGLQIASSGTEYYVAWMKDYYNLVGSRMSSTGVLATPAGTTIVSDVSQYSESAVAHDGTQWWFLWTAGPQLRTVRVSAAGTVLDPGGGVLLPITIGGSIDYAYGPTVTGRSGGGALVTWYDLRAAMGSDANVWMLPVSAANAPGTERCLSTGTRTQRMPDLSHGPGSASVLAYVSEAANDRRVMVQLLDEDGAPTATPPIEVAGAPTIGQASVAWNGALFLVVWDEGASGLTPATIRGRRMNANGSFVDATPFDVMPGFGPDVESLGEDFLVACARYGAYPQNIYAMMRIVDGPTGTFQNAATLIGGSYVNVGPRVRRGDGEWLVTYHSHWSHDNSASDMVYQRVHPDGTFTPASNPLLTSGGAGTPDVAFSGSRYLFVWRNNSLSNANNYIAGRIMNADGTFATGHFTIAEATGRQLRPSAGWDGTHFVVVWDDQRNQEAFFDERTDVYGARVSSTGVVIDPQGFAIHAGPQGGVTAALLTRADGHAIVASARWAMTPPYDAYRIGTAYVGDGSTLAVDLEPGERALALAAPNPFRGATTLTFALPRDGRVTLAVHDVQGRVVRTLAAGERAAGRHAIAWDGRDDAGARVAPGVYLVALRTREGTVARRVVRLDD